jgi:hypothetical protein
LKGKIKVDVMDRAYSTNVVEEKLIYVIGEKAMRKETSAEDQDVD